MIHDVARRDTPEQVEVPETWAGLAIWALGRFGGVLLLAGAASYASVRVYDDLGRQQERMMLMIEKRSETDVQMTQVLLGLKAALDELARDARTAHRGGE